MSEQQLRSSSNSGSDDAEEELTPAGMFAALVFGVPLILIVLCAVFDFPASLFQ